MSDIIESNNSPFITTKQAVIDIAAITTIWFIIIFIVNPIGDFPLNDDWLYGITVERFLENGQYNPTGWVSMPLLTNVLWGSLFCLPAGFSYTALRISTLVLSITGIIGTYLLIRDFRQPRYMVIIATLTLAANPVYYLLSYTFMTDVSYTAIIVFSGFFFSRNLRSNSSRDLIIATILVVAATLSRQLAIAIPIAYGLTLIYMNGIKLRYLLQASAPIIISTFALLIFQRWSIENHRLPEQYYIKSAALAITLDNPKWLVKLLIANFHSTFLYMGLFLSPYLILSAKNLLKLSRKYHLLLIGLLLELSAWLILNEKFMPISSGVAQMMPFNSSVGNIIIKSGFGPLALPYLNDNGLSQILELPKALWFVVTLISILGGALLLTIIFARCFEFVNKQGLQKKQSNNFYIGFFLLLSSIIYFLPLIASNTFFDRYFVPVLPFVLAGLIGISNPILSRLETSNHYAYYPANAILVFFSLFAVLGTKDYLTWNRVRWLALNDLTNNNETNIDGGNEFNGYTTFRMHNDTKVYDHMNYHPSYRIAFTNEPDFTEINEYNYSKWLLPHTEKILVLKRNQ